MSNLELTAAFILILLGLGLGGSMDAECIRIGLCR